MVIVATVFDNNGILHSHRIIVSILFQEKIINLQWFANFCPWSLQSLFDPFTNPNGASASTGRRSFWGGSGGSGGGGGGSDGRG